jgi:hypothetical protein
MKLKKITQIFAIFAIFALAVTPVFANGDEYESELIAGQDDGVGMVRLYFDPSDFNHDLLYIEIDADCDILETHVWVGDDLEDVPRTKKGNPKIGHFPYAMDLAAGTQNVVMEVDTSMYAGKIYILVHAVVDCPCGEETAWADTFGTPFSDRPDIFGRRWGYFLTIYI